MKTVAHFREPYLAHVAKGKLEAEGIPAVVADEHLVQINWTLSQAIGGVKVQVPEEAVEISREILKKDYLDEISMFEEAQIKPEPDEFCPKCGSTSIISNPYSLWSLIPSIMFQLPIFFRRKKWRCNDCGATW